jgi:hypothetical protein
MWASWLIHPGQSLTSRLEQKFARRKVTNCVEPKEWRIVGHNESEGMELRNRTQLHRAKVSTSSKPVSLHALIGLVSLSQPLPDDPDFVSYRLLGGLTEVINTCFWLHKDLLRKSLS